jgi:transcriptional regulator with XRE-family HTH domain
LGTSTTSDRVRNVRKRRGLTQRELATASGLSLSFVKKLEQGEYADLRLETAHKLAVALRVPTAAIMPRHQAPDDARPDIAQAWEPVLRALSGAHPQSALDQEPTVASVREALDEAVTDVVDNHYAEVRVMLPPLLRDADDLVAASASGATADARHLRSEGRQLAAYMLGQTRQFSAAGNAIELAAADADDPLTAMAAADWKSWILIRQGRLDDALTVAPLADESA